MLLEIKEAAAKAHAARDDQITKEAQSAYLRRYDRLVKKAAKLNPQRPREPGAPKQKSSPQPTPRKIVDRLQRHRDDILRFMTDLSVPFDNNGSERDLRMVKLQQKIGGCFRTEDGARDFCRVRSYLSTAHKQGYSLLYSLERVLSGKPPTFQPAAADTS